MGLAWYHLMLLGFTGFLEDFVGFHWFFMDLAWYHLMLLGFTGFLEDFVGFHWFFLGLAWYHLILLGFTGFYWLFIGFRGLPLVFLGLFWIDFTEFVFFFIWPDLFIFLCLVWFFFPLDFCCFASFSSEPWKRGPEPEF